MPETLQGLCCCVSMAAKADSLTSMLFTSPNQSLMGCNNDRRYAEYLFDTDAHVPFSEASGGRVSAAERGIHKLKVYVASNDQSLNLQTDESYALIVSAPTSTLEVSHNTPSLRYTISSACILWQRIESSLRLDGGLHLQMNVLLQSAVSGTLSTEIHLHAGQLRLRRFERPRDIFPAGRADRPS